MEKENPHASLMAVSGTGLGKDGLFITFYEGFSAYTEAMSMVKQLPHIDVYSVDSFLVDLNQKRPVWNPDNVGNNYACFFHEIVEVTCSALAMLGVKLERVVISETALVLLCPIVLCFADS